MRRNGGARKSMAKVKKLDTVSGPSRVNDYLDRKSKVADAILGTVSPALGNILSNMIAIVLKHSPDEVTAFGIMYDTLGEMFAKKAPAAKVRREIASDLSPLLQQARTCGLFLNAVEMVVLKESDTNTAYTGISMEFVLEKLHVSMVEKIGPCPLIWVGVNTGDIPPPLQTATINNLKYLDTADVEVADACFKAYWAVHKEQIQLTFSGQIPFGA